MSRFINGWHCSNEAIGKALRKAVPTLPEPAVSELVANAMVHQDYFVTGAMPLVEIFDDRIEVTTPAAVLVAIERVSDLPSLRRSISPSSCDELESARNAIVSGAKGCPMSSSISCQHRS